MGTDSGWVQDIPPGPPSPDQTDRYEPEDGQLAALSVCLPPRSVRGAAPPGSFCGGQHPPVGGVVSEVRARLHRARPCPLAQPVPRPAETRPDRRIAAAEALAANGKAPGRPDRTRTEILDIVQVGRHPEAINHNFGIVGSKNVRGVAFSQVQTGNRLRLVRYGRVASSSEVSITDIVVVFVIDIQIYGKT